VAIIAENSAATLLTYVAATLAGTSAVAVNFHLEPAELAFVLRDSGAAVVLTDVATEARARAGAELAGVTTVITNLGATGDDAEPPTDHPPLPPAVYTSGSTGRP
jgi:long-chain acyl-CoA synthetase